MTGWAATYHPATAAMCSEKYVDKDRETSNVTGHQRGLKRKLRVGVAICSTFLQILLIFSSPDGYWL